MTIWAKASSAIAGTTSSVICNEKFAKFLQMLYIAKKKSCKIDEMHAQLEKRLAQRGKMEKEAHLKRTTWSYTI